METNALLGHGISSFIKESMMRRSDEYEFFVDNYDGTIANHDCKNIHTNISTGSHPKSTNMDFSKIQAPYAFKLLVQELEALSITPRLLTDETDDRYGVPEENDEEYVYVDRDSDGTQNDRDEN
jgi:DNA-directed RNA polymerase beta subunit